MTSTIRISEIFGPTIQGEGALIGQPTVFVRTGGCDYRCSWCDTLYAVESKYRHDWKPMTAQEIMDEVKRLSNNTPITISLSGGNPATQDCSELIKIGQKDGYTFALETQGSIACEWFKDLDTLTLSPKPPSSSMTTDWSIFDECLKQAGIKTETALKIVVFDDIDYTYAKDAATRHPNLPIYLQPGNHQTNGDADINGLNEHLDWLVEKVTNDNWFKPRILPQLHVMIWGNKRGV